jgi:DNA-binding response OmpR family regulator
MSRVLIVDDDPQLLRALRINLVARHHDVQVATTGADALQLAAIHLPDLVLLDLGLPDLDGVDVIHGLRGWTDVPIIVLSGRSGGPDKVAALDAGADDYVTKPFGVEELLARMRAVARRGSGAEGGDPVVRFGDLSIDLVNRTVTGPTGAGPSGAGAVSADSEPIHLTPHRMARVGGLPAPARCLAVPALPPREGVGRGIPQSAGKPAPLCLPTATQTRARPRSSATPGDRARHGLPLPAMTRSGQPKPSDGLSPLVVTLGG